MLQTSKPKCKRNFFGAADFVYTRNPVSPELNVGVNEILDAAKESIKTHRAVELKP